MSGTNSNSEAQLTGRQRRRLRLARETGYFHNDCREGPQLLAIYSRWCWRLRIPIVWYERRSAHSRYGRVHLDLYTTANSLTVTGQAKLAALAKAARLSPHDGHWDRVPLRELDRLSAAVLRAATRPENYRLNQVRQAKVRYIDLPRTGTA